MGTLTAQNTTLKLADNQAPTTTAMQHNKTQWVATWKENLTLATPDKLGQHVGMQNILNIVRLHHTTVDPHPLSLGLLILAPVTTISP